MKTLSIEELHAIAESQRVERDRQRRARNAEALAKVIACAQRRVKA